MSETENQAHEKDVKEIPIFKHPWFLYAVIHIGIIAFILLIIGVVMSTGITR